MNKIETTIHKDGSVDLKLTEFDNLSCLDTTRTIEYLLGDENINRHFYYARLDETIPATPEVAAVKAF
jgi:hypothetical protein